MTNTTTTTTTPTTVVTPPAMEVNGASVDNETETEGWTCSQCTFQNHPELNMCEQCGMVKRPPPHRSPVMMQQQQPPSHIPPAGIVQITSSQFIPAHGSNAAANNQTPAHLIAGVPLTNRMPAPPVPHPSYMMQSYSGHSASPRMVYTSPMCQYPSAFSYPQIMTPTSNASGGASPVSSTGGTYSPGQMLTPQFGESQQQGSGGRSPKERKKKSKFNSKFSQSISNLFSSSSSSSTPGAASSNSQE